MKYLLTLSLLFVATLNLRAEVDSSDLALADETIDSPALNIEGQYQLKTAPKTEIKKVVVKKPLSASEKIRLYREQLEIRNQIMVQKKMEQIRLQQELALAKKLEHSMNQTMQAIDKAVQE